MSNDARNEVRLMALEITLRSLLHRMPRGAKNQATLWPYRVVKLGDYFMSFRDGTVWLRRKGTRAEQPDLSESRVETA